jgi:hypothetical protein
VWVLHARPPPVDATRGRTTNENRVYIEGCEVRRILLRESRQNRGNSSSHLKDPQPE